MLFMYPYAIANSLQEWDKKYDTGGNLGWEYYRSMAFAGLVKEKRDADNEPILDNNGEPIYEDTDSFKELVPDENDRDNIKKINSDEATGNSDSKGTKCN